MSEGADAQDVWAHCRATYVERRRIKQPSQFFLFLRLLCFH
jgi:hypothetical protein